MGESISQPKPPTVKMALTIDYFNTFAHKDAAWDVLHALETSWKEEKMLAPLRPIETATLRWTPPTPKRSPRRSSTSPKTSRRATRGARDREGEHTGTCGKGFEDVWRDERSTVQRVWSEAWLLLEMDRGELIVRCVWCLFHKNTETLGRDAGSQSLAGVICCSSSPPVCFWNIWCIKWCIFFSKCF